MYLSVCRRADTSVFLLLLFLGILHDNSFPSVLFCTLGSMKTTGNPNQKWVVVSVLTCGFQLGDSELIKVCSPCPTLLG